MDGAAVPKHYNLEHSMSRRGNCLDNAVAESFFNLLKRERIRRKTYRMREKARQDVFDDIEMFHNPRRKHVRNGMLSPIAFERRHNSSPMASTKLGALHLHRRLLLPARETMRKTPAPSDPVLRAQVTLRHSID